MGLYINKSEVTQGDGDYASYSAFTKNGNTYFFISTASENPQVLKRNGSFLSKASAGTEMSL